jgi:hypothetical protein
MHDSTSSQGPGDTAPVHLDQRQPVVLEDAVGEALFRVRQQAGDRDRGVLPAQRGVVVAGPQETRVQHRHGVAGHHVDLGVREAPYAVLVELQRLGGASERDAGGGRLVGELPEVVRVGVRTGDGPAARSQVDHRGGEADLDAVPLGGQQGGPPGARGVAAVFAVVGERTHPGAPGRVGPLQEVGPLVVQAGAAAS